MVNTKHILLFYLIAACSLKCSFIYPPINIQLPSDYSGWCHVIPIQDTSGINVINKENESGYMPDKNGIVYIPASKLDLRQDNIIKVFENGIDISMYKQYAGTVEKIPESGIVYNFIRFYIPIQEERDIEDNQYWRDSRYKYSQLDKFDSLLQQGIVVFK